MTRLLCLLGGITMVLVFLGIRYFDDPFSARRFDQKTWIRFHDSDARDNPRGQMVNDLKTRHLKIGMFKEDVLASLGPADNESKKSFLSYNLGCWSGFRIDYDSLDLSFDESGRLSKIEVMQH